MNVFFIGSHTELNFNQVISKCQKKKKKCQAKESSKNTILRINSPPPLRHKTMHEPISIYSKKIIAKVQFYIGLIYDGKKHSNE